MAVTRQVGAMTDAKLSAIDLRGKEFFLAKRTVFNGESAFTLAGAGESVAGVISEGKNVGLHTSVDTGNQLKAVAAGAIVPDDELASDANGKVVKAAGGAMVFARAISAAAAGELVEFNIVNEGRKA